jgi:lipid-binding SYLF domain-containing protein
MKTNRLALVAVAGLTALLGACATPKGASVAEKRAYVKQMRDETLAELYRREPALRARVRAAPGYAVFSNLSVGVLLVGTGHGYGFAHDNRTGRDVYMRMAELGVGAGIGARDFRALYVFQDAATFQAFVEKGWEFGADADVAAIAGGDRGVAMDTSGHVGAGGVAAGGGAALGTGGASDHAAGSVGSGIEVYQLTENGLALRAGVGGTKYWRDAELNP